MKKFRVKYLLFLTAVLFAAGCAGREAVQAASPPTDPSLSELSAAEAASQADPVVPSRKFEKVSYETLPVAEQIYNSLYYFADFTRYTTFELRGDLDTNDRVMVERIYFPYAGLDDETIGTTHFETFYRIAGGHLSNGVDFAEYLDHFASSVYISKTFSEWVKEKFTVSDGKIYVSEYAVDFSGNWGKTAFLTLDKISFSDGLIPSIELDFSYTDHWIGGEEEVQAKFTIMMSSRGDGWKIDECSEKDGTVALVNEFFYNEPSSPLQEQIERCLKECGLTQPET